MSEDMSVFKKMRDKITDEMSSATNKLQNIQITDRLPTSIAQQIVKSDPIPHQNLPDLHEQTNVPTNNRFSLVDHDNSNDNPGGDEELNSEISPQHQLFNERSIRRLKSPSNPKMAKTKNGSDQNMVPALNHNNQNPVIDMDHLSSDLEDDICDPTTNDDVEIDLLAEKELPTTSNRILEDKLSHSQLTIYKTRYREVVHALRKLNVDRQLEEAQLRSQTETLTNQIAALRGELMNIKQQRESTNDPSGDRRTGSSSPHQTSRQSNKIRDLEKLMAKCKESLKAKNVQLKILKDALGEVDKFKDYLEDVKSELKELGNAHETWTLSIAENKRIMHQEIEDKNAEMKKLRCEINDLHSQLKDGNNRSMQLRSNIQNLESRLVNTSAAHQKERESLIKELTAAKNNAIKQLLREHELHVERVKLNLEKSIEALKSDILAKDEQIIRSAEKQQELQVQNCKLTTDLENTRRTLDDQKKDQFERKAKEDEHVKEIEDLKSRLEVLSSQKSSEAQCKANNEELEKQNQQLNLHVAELSAKVDQFDETNRELKLRLEVMDNEAKQHKEEKPCSNCLELKQRLGKGADEYEQSLFELNAKLNLMTTANNDQEKALIELKAERDSASDTIRSLRLECDEFVKKNESLLQVMQDNESEMQTQLDQMTSVKQQLESLKKENSSLSSNVHQLTNELNDRNSDLMQSSEMIDNLTNRLAEVELALRNSSTDLDSLKKEKESLKRNLESESKKRKEADEQLVVNILAALKNLETPDTSPGSDKTYKPEAAQSSDINQEISLPDPIKLAEDLSSLALDRSNAYMTSNQRLQAVLLDNTMISEELKRLKEELNAFNKERSLEIMTILEEVERLRTENQALIHDQKAYDDHIASLEAEIESLRQRLGELESSKAQMIEASTATSTIDETSEVASELESKNQEIEQLRRIIAEREEEKRCLEPTESTDVPSSTEFKYLKNIVYQFLMGREPITLARVISAIFKFDKNQMEQICKIQEVIHQVSS